VGAIDLGEKMKRFMRFSNTDSDKNSSSVDIYNIRYDYILSILKEDMIEKLTRSQLKKFNRLNVENDIEISLILEEF